MLGLIKSEATRNGDQIPYQLTEYRGHKVARFDAGIMARVGSSLLRSNQTELAKEVADNLIDGAPDSLSSQSSFFDSFQHQGDSDIWPYVDLESLRTRQFARELLSRRTDNLAAKLLIGGILEALKHGSTATFSAKLNREKLAIARLLGKCQCCGQRCVQVKVSA